MPPLCFQALKRKPPAYPTELRTLGDHIRAKRFDLGLDQKEASKHFGINPGTLLNWEKNHTEPHVHAYPAAMKFLGYCPVQYAESVGARIRLHRTHRGLTILELANILGVDQSTVANWERGLKSPFRQSTSFIRKIYGLPHQT